MKYDIDSLEYKITSCRDMCESTICYYGEIAMDNYFNSNRDIVDTINLASDILMGSKYLGKYEDSLGASVVMCCIVDILNKLDHIEYDVYEDSDGLNYNSMIWKN